MRRLVGVDLGAAEAGWRDAVRLLRLDAGLAQDAPCVRLLVLGASGNVSRRLATPRGLDHAGKKVLAALDDCRFGLLKSVPSLGDSAQSSTFIARTLRHVAKFARRGRLNPHVSTPDYTCPLALSTVDDETRMYHNEDPTTGKTERASH